MEDYIVWLIYFITFIGLSSVGIYIYAKERLREKVNLDEVFQLFWIVIILRIFDVLSTVYFTNKIGIETEGNLIARAFMLQFGIGPGIILMFMLSIPLMFFWFILINYLFKNRFGWKLFRALIITISIIVPLMNLSV